MKNENAKSFEFNWKEYDCKYDLYLQLGRYTNNSNLFLGLVYYDSEIEDYESFNDLTINVPMTPLENNGIWFDKNKETEIIINGDLGKEIRKTLYSLPFLKKTNRVVQSGFATYEVALFNYEKAKDYIIWEEL
jgi:hypothetical protein